VLNILISGLALPKVKLEKLLQLQALGGR
jgi:hypothetical protein